MDPCNAPEEQWALLLGRSAKCNDMIERVSREFIQRFGPVGGNIYSYFGQSLYRLWIHASLLGPRGICFELIAEVVVDKAFRHLGTAGVVGAEKEDAVFHKEQFISALADKSSPS